jgi:hypothetical protein
MNPRASTRWCYTSKRFTITARMERARLPGVGDQMAVQGYTRIVLAENLDEQQAEVLRDQTRADYTAQGYEYQTRPALS